MVDLHVLRVASRLGIASGDDANKMEKQLMDKLPKEQWDVGMAMSHLEEKCADLLPNVRFV